MRELYHLVGVSAVRPQLLHLWPILDRVCQEAQRPEHTQSKGEGQRSERWGGGGGRRVCAWLCAAADLPKSIPCICCVARSLSAFAFRSNSTSSFDSFETRSFSSSAI